MLYIVDQTPGKLGRGEDLKSVIPWLVLEKSLLHFPPCPFHKPHRSCPGRPCTRLFVSGGSRTRPLLLAQNSLGCLDILFGNATQALCIEG
ncbi:hypothetical protein ACE6H2_018260 [Prunus campanulata]